MKLIYSKKVILGIILVGYVATWILAPQKVRLYLKADALAQYDRARIHEEEQKEKFVKEGLITESEYESNINPSGPSSGLDWSVPVAPCLLLAQDYYVIGPLWGAGHLSLYFYYGPNVIRIVQIQTWIS